MVASEHVTISVEIDSNQHVVVDLRVAPKAPLNFAAKEFVPTFQHDPAEQQTYEQQMQQHMVQEYVLPPYGGQVMNNLVAYYDAAGRYLYTAPYDPYSPLASYPLYPTNWEYQQSGYQQENATIPAVYGFDQQAYIQAAVAMLSDLFPLYSMEQLAQTFAEQNYDVVATTDLLLAVENQTTPVSSQQQPAARREKGAVQAVGRGKVVKARRVVPINLASEADFPSLGGTSLAAHRARGRTPEEGSVDGPTGSPRGCRMGSASTSDSMTAPSVSTPDGSVKDMSIAQDHAVSASLDETADGTIRLSISVAIDSIETDSTGPGVPEGPSKTPRSSAWGPQTAPPSFLAAARKAATEDGKHNGKQQMDRHTPPPAPRTPVKTAVPLTPRSNTPRVATGAAASQQYKAARALASDLARTRNMYFMQATQAYLAGNRKLAKELGAKGRQFNDQMKAAHANASADIYRSRNSSKHSANFVDLHGLHVKEALDQLSRELERRKNKQQGLQICVGTGSHTKASRARLPGAVEKLLQQRQLSYAYAMPGLIQLY